MERRAEHNQRLLANAKLSGDEKLDVETYRKTVTEVERGVLVGPYTLEAEIPHDEIAVVPGMGYGSSTARLCSSLADA